MLSSTLAPNFAGEKEFSEAARNAGLYRVRTDNFQRLLNAVPPRGAGKTPARVLEVGPGPGLFLEAARARGLDVIGVEPDSEMAAQLQGRGFSVVEGVFPNPALAGQTFDYIAFNDVLEHIADIDAVLAACRRHLNPQGTLLINLPSAQGVIYRAAAAMARAGVRGPYERMWQKDFVSPHLHYFRPALLTRAVEQRGFKRIAAGSLPSLTWNGLGDRIRYGHKQQGLGALAVQIAATLYLPLSALLPADSIYQAFQPAS
ncbi:MAG: class I SAM-dependent methyltransferase [Pseudomonadota bacterium]